MLKDAVRGFVCTFAVWSMVSVVMEGCATKPTTLAQAAPLPPAPAAVCIPTKTYTLEEEKALAAFTAIQPANSIQFEALLDYGRVRKAARAACAISK